MRITALLVGALVVATPALAFRPRPVSYLQFGNRLDSTFYGSYAGYPSFYRAAATAAASDGDDGYLVLLQMHIGGTYTQVMSHGVPYGPAVLIGVGSGFSSDGSVVWTGSEYLVAWASKDGVCLSVVSRSGALLSGPRLLIAGSNLSAKAVSNGRRVLVTANTSAGLRGILVDLSGQPIGAAFDMASGSHSYAITGTGDGFAMAKFGYDETRVFRYDDAAQQVIAGGTRIEGPYVGHADSYYSHTGTITGDGTNVAVIFTASAFQTPCELKTAIIGARGEIVQPSRTIMTGLADPSGIVAVSALWNGTEYIVTLELRRDVNANQIDAALQRVSRTGERLDDPSLLVVPNGRQEPSAMASNGREYLITVEEPIETFFVRVPVGSTTASEPAYLTRSLNPQQWLAIAGGRRDYLAAWLETGRNGLTIRASRIDSRGRYLDGSGIVVATLSAPLPTSSHPISVDSDGQNWLVVWSAGYLVQGRRVSADGVLLDPQPISIGPGAQAAVGWGGDSWLVVSVNGDLLNSTTVSPDGIAGSTTLIGQAPSGSGTVDHPYVSYESPAIVFDGRNFVLALTRHAAYCVTAVQPYCGQSISVLTSRLGTDGSNIVGSTFLTPEDAATSSIGVATNGSQHLVVYQQGAKVGGVLLNEGHDPAPIAITDGWKSGLDVMWNGREFVVALSSADGPLQLVSISAQGTVGSTLTVPRDPDEHSSGAVFPRSFPAEQTTTPASGRPLAFLTQHDAYDAVPRAAFAFIADFQEALLSPQVPAAPSIGRAIADSGGFTLTWVPQDHVLGFSIELRQPDGSERVIGIAAGSASSTHVSYAGLTGTTVRLRAWNSAGLSSPSSEVQPTARQRAVRK